jgi:hypothetical protein
MKKIGFIALFVSLLCCLPAQAQFGGLLDKGKKAVNKAKEVKEKVDDEVKKVNGDVDFFFMDAHKGFYRSRNRKIFFDDLHKEGERSGKNVIYTIEKNGDVKFDDGRKVGEVLDGGIVNCHSTAPYLTLTNNGDVVMDGETIGHIDDKGNVTLEGMSIGKATGVDKQVAAYIFFGILYDKQGINSVRTKIKEEKLRVEQERKQAEEARIKAAQEAEAKRKAAAANQPKNTQASTNKASGKKTSSNTKASTPKVQEWTIEKGSSRGYVDANGVVYDSSHRKIGQLPNGSGDIKDASGSTIGRISMGDIYDRSGNKVATVSSGGSISVPGSNASVAEVRGSGRIDMTKDSKTLGYCDVRPYEWAVAIIFCDIFRF